MSEEQLQDLAIGRLRTASQIRKYFDPQIIAAIAASLLECGQLQPIRVRPSGDDFVIVDGEMRYRAARVAGLATIKAIVESRELREAEVTHRQLVANCHRSNLNDIEKAKAIALLMDQAGWNASQTAGKLGFSAGTVTKLLSLLTLSEPLQQQVRNGEISASAAYALTSVEDDVEQQSLAARVASGELTRDGLQKVIKRKSDRPPRARKTRPIRVTAKLENRERVSVAAESLDIKSFMSILEKLLAHAQQAHSEGLTLDVMLKRLAPKRSATVASSHTI